MSASTDYHLIHSRGEFHDALRAALAEAASVGCREMLWCDNDYADWPLDEVAVIDSLTQWAQPHRSLTVLAQSFDEFNRRHPRWVNWRRTWSHVVDCRSNRELEAGQIPCVLLAPGLLTLRLVDPLRYRGSVSRTAADAVQGREQIDAILQRSEAAFPVTSLGL